jgi:cytochrome b561
VIRRGWQRLAARVSHWTLYLASLLLAMLGWAHSSSQAHNDSNRLGLFQLAQFTSPDQAAADAYGGRDIHVLLALVALQVAAAAWHHFIRRDGVALRMVRSEAR